MLNFIKYLQVFTPMKLKQFFFTFFLFSFSLSVLAQDIAELGPKDYLNFQLPPISILYENAKASPILNYYEKKKQATKSLMDSEKKRWLNFIKLITNYQYGIIGNNITFSDTNTPIFYQYSGNKQSWYNFGVSVAIPLDDLFDRKNRVKKQRLDMEATEFEQEKWYDEQKIRIATIYSLAMRDLGLIKIKSEALLFTEAQLKLSEDDFINGKISVQDLGRQKSAYTTAASEYEVTKADLNSSLLQLEILARTKIISK